MLLNTQITKPQINTVIITDMATIHQDHLIALKHRKTNSTTKTTVATTSIKRAILPPSIIASLFPKFFEPIQHFLRKCKNNMILKPKKPDQLYPTKNNYKRDWQNGFDDSKYNAVWDSQ